MNLYSITLEQCNSYKSSRVESCELSGYDASTLNCQGSGSNYKLCGGCGTCNEGMAESYLAELGADEFCEEDCIAAVESYACVLNAVAGGCGVSRELSTITMKCECPDRPRCFSCDEVPYRDWPYPGSYTPAVNACEALGYRSAGYNANCYDYNCNVGRYGSGFWVCTLPQSSSSGPSSSSFDPDIPVSSGWEPGQSSDSRRPITNKDGDTTGFYEGGGGEMQCGWGRHPPCNTYETNNPPGLCEASPSVCNAIRDLPGKLDSLRFPDSIVFSDGGIIDAIGRLGGKLDSLDRDGYDDGELLSKLGDIYGILDSGLYVNFPDSVFGGPGDYDTISGVVDGLPSGWRDSINSITGFSAVDTTSFVAAKTFIDNLTDGMILNLSDACPDFPAVSFSVAGRSIEIDYDICQPMFYFGGTHILVLFGRATLAIVVIFSAIALVHSIPASSMIAQAKRKAGGS